MFIKFIKKLLKDNREFILREAFEAKGLMHLLMKSRNSGGKWSKEDIAMLRAHLRSLTKIAPAVAIFLLPGGMLLLPFLAELLDRRKNLGLK